MVGLSVVLAGLIQGCAPEFWNGVAQGMAASQNSSSFAGNGGAGATHKLMVFGGPGHATYLGCLNCSEYANDSVFNENGPHGSPYASESIFNAYSRFGGQYGAYSPCNPYASDPPVIVDENGAFYGRLTVNAYNPQASHDATIQGWLERVVCK
jgi:hypothetical protein